MGAFLIGAVLFFQVLRSLNKRFRAERERQKIITRPKAIARTGEVSMIKAPLAKKDEQESFYAELEQPYHFYQQAAPVAGTRVAPGEMRLKPTQSTMLNYTLTQHPEVYAFIDPKGEAAPCLTPGPSLFGWAYILKVLLVVIVTAALGWWLEQGFAMMVVLWTAIGVLTNQFGEFYTTDLHKWLEPVNTVAEAPEQQAQPSEKAFIPSIVEEQVQTDVEEANLVLPPLEDQPKKITLRR